MSDDPTPMEMLREYRRRAAEFDNEQVEMFKGLSANDKTELLFRMLFSTNTILRHLHERLDGPQPVRGMSGFRPQ